MKDLCQYGNRPEDEWEILPNAVGIGPDKTYHKAATSRDAPINQFLRYTFFRKNRQTAKTKNRNT